jgi:putative transposase
MPQKRHTVDQIVAKLRKADVELGKGKKVPEVCKLLEITEQTYYRWRRICRVRTVIAWRGGRCGTPHAAFPSARMRALLLVLSPELSVSLLLQAFQVFIKEPLRQLNRLACDERRDASTNRINPIRLSIQQSGVQRTADALIESISQIAGLKCQIDA